MLSDPNCSSDCAPASRPTPTAWANPSNSSSPGAGRCAGAPTAFCIASTSKSPHGHVVAIDHRADIYRHAERVKSRFTRACRNPRPDAPSRPAHHLARPHLPGGLPSRSTLTVAVAVACSAGIVVTARRGRCHRSRCSDARSGHPAASSQRWRFAGYPRRRRFSPDRQCRPAQGLVSDHSFSFAPAPPLKQARTMSQPPTAAPDSPDHETAARLAAGVESFLDVSREAPSADFQVQLTSARATLAVYYELRALRTYLLEADRARHADFKLVMDEVLNLARQIDRLG